MPVRIAHIHVWDQTNKGDYGIVLAVQEQLRAVWPDQEIIDFPVEVLKSYDPVQLTHLNQCDLIILGGGGIFYSYFLPFDRRMISGLRTPLAIYGAGYIREVGARPLTATARDSLLYLVKKARFVGVRENYTKRFLVRYGADPKKIKVIGDPALFLSEAKPPRSILSQKSSGRRKFQLGLNLNYSGWLGFGRWQDDILQSYRTVARYFQDRYGAQVYYLQHHPGEAKIYPKLKIKDLKVIDFKPRQQKGFYSSLDLVVGMMLHSCVMSIGAGVPAINVAYDLRNRNFARFIGCPELVVELPELASGELISRAKLVVAHQAAYRNKLAVIKSRVTKKSTDFLKMVKDNLNL